LLQPITDSFPCTATITLALSSRKKVSVIIQHKAFLQFKESISHQPTCFASATAPQQLRFVELQGSFDGGRIPNDLVSLSQLQ